MQQHLETLRQIARTQRRRAESAEARVAELEAALVKIIDLNSGSFPLPWDTQRVAREALNP